MKDTVKSLKADLVQISKDLDRTEKELAALETQTANLSSELNMARTEVMKFIEEYKNKITPPIPVPTPPAAPAAPNDDPNDPSLFIPPVGDFNDPSFVTRFIARGIWVSGHRVATDRDYQYWSGIMPGLVARGIEINVPDYAWRRIIGWQAGAEDKPLFGPYR